MFWAIHMVLQLSCPTCFSQNLKISFRKEILRKLLWCEAQRRTIRIRKPPFYEFSEKSYECPKFGSLYRKLFCYGENLLSVCITSGMVKARTFHSKQGLLYYHMAIQAWMQIFTFFTAYTLPIHCASFVKNTSSYD